jgi:beta-RFAP synthase
VPAHAGLGSGTQIALAVAAALRRLHGLPLDPRGDAVRLGRGARSGIGIGLFDAGGVVLDGGRGEREEPPPVIARLPFPEKWRVLLVLDPRRSGVHGADELDAFSALPLFHEEDAAHLCRLALMRALPALAEEDIAAFGAAITEIQACVGDHFAPAQGGRFASPTVAAALDLLAEAGASGYGQSSWGPTGFAFAPDEAEARRLQARLAPLAERLGLAVHVGRGRNSGAEIETRDTARERGVRHG